MTNNSNALYFRQYSINHKQMENYILNLFKVQFNPTEIGIPLTGIRIPLAEIGIPFSEIIIFILEL